MRLCKLLTLCLMTTLLSGFPSAAEAAIKLKVWTANPEGDPVLTALRDAFKPYVEKESNGAYIVEIYPGSTLGGPDTAYQGVQFGSIQFVVDSINNIGQFVPQLAALDVPYLLPTREKLEKAFASEAAQTMFDHARKKGIEPLKVVLSTYRGLLSMTPIKTLEDARGVKDRTSNSRYHIATIRALGMNPTPMAPSEVLTAMQQGVIEAVDYDLPNFISQRIVDVAKNLLLSEHLPVLYMAYTNAEWWNGLPAKNREIMIKGFALFDARCKEIYATVKEESIKAAREKYGCTVTELSPEEKARWIETSKGALKEFPADIVKIAEALRAAGEGK